MKRLVGVLAAVALALGVSIGMAQPAVAGSVWDRVARCESGGNWKTNTGNGYYGGLQFARRTWNGFGGKRYAATADKASKGEQIRIARKVLARQGPGAWGSCGRKAGLTKSSGRTGGAAHDGKSSRHQKQPANQHAKKQVTATDGTTLAKVAKRYHVKGGWKKVYRLNAGKLTRAHVGKHAHRRLAHTMVLRIRR